MRGELSVPRPMLSSSELVEQVSWDTDSKQTERQVRLTKSDNWTSRLFVFWECGTPELTYVSLFVCLCFSLMRTDTYLNKWVRLQRWQKFDSYWTKEDFTDADLRFSYRNVHFTSLVDVAGYKTQFIKPGLCLWKTKVLWFYRSAVSKWFSNYFLDRAFL